LNAGVSGSSLLRLDWIETGLSILDLTRFLDANRFPPPDQLRGHASLENDLSTTRSAHPSEWRPARPAGRCRKIKQLRQTRCCRIFPTKLLMRGPVQRCERLSACQDSNEISSQYPCPSRCLHHCDEGSMQQAGSAKYVRRTREPKGATAMRFFVWIALIRFTMFPSSRYPR
jgi:hypothetical protein